MDKDAGDKIIGTFFERLDVLKVENPYSTTYSIEFTRFTCDSTSGLESLIFSDRYILIITLIKVTFYHFINMLAYVLKM